MLDHVAHLGIRHRILDTVDHEQRGDGRICDPGRRGSAQGSRVGRDHPDIVAYGRGEIRKIWSRAKIRKVICTRETNSDVEAVISKGPGGDAKASKVPPGRSPHRSDLSIATRVGASGPNGEFYVVRLIREAAIGNLTGQKAWRSQSIFDRKSNVARRGQVLTAGNRFRRAIRRIGIEAAAMDNEARAPEWSACKQSSAERCRPLLCRKLRFVESRRPERGRSWQD